MADKKEITDTSAYIEKEFDEGIPVSYNQRDLLLYACGIGCSDLKYVYEFHDEFAAFPTYPVILSFKGTEQGVCSFPSEAMFKTMRSPPLPGAMGGLDGERYIERVAPLNPQGDDLILQSRLVGIHKRGSGASVETEARLVGKDGKLYNKFVSGAFMVGAKDFSDSGVSYSEKVPAPDCDPHKTEEFVTSPFQTHIYRLSGDYNQLHIDPSVAKMYRFPAPILHGLCTLGIATRAVIKAFANNDPTSFRAIKLRFSAPVLPGQTVVTNMWKDATHPDRVIFNCVTKETGAVVINNAYVDFTPSSKL